MAKNNQTPPGLNAPSVYSRAVTALADIFNEEEENNNVNQRSGRVTLERPQDYVKRAAREGTEVDIAFSSGGLLSKNKSAKKPKENNMREDQRVFLEIVRRRRQYKNKGKA